MTPRQKTRGKKDKDWQKWESLSFVVDCLLAEMENQNVSYHELARRMGTSKGNMHRDLHRRNIGSWSVLKLLNLATAMGFKLQCALVERT